jgi:hypothetical protein
VRCGVLVFIVLGDACPAGVIWAGHYRPDGSCRCDPAEDSTPAVEAPDADRQG